MGGKNYVDHTNKTQQGPDDCRPATPVTQRTIEIGVDKTDTDLICISVTDYIDDNFDYRNIRLTFTQECKGQDRNQPPSFVNDDVFVTNRVQTPSMNAQHKLNKDSPIEEILDFNFNSESQIKTRLNIYNQKDRT